MGQMVDISDKDVTVRKAKAKATYWAKPETIEAVRDKNLPKGDALEAAKLAAVGAVKQTPLFVTYAHPIKVTNVAVEFDIFKDHIDIYCSVKAVDRTGAEMEALTGAAVAALNIYDIAKMVDKTAYVTEITLLEKSGGKSGDYKRI